MSFEVPLDRSHVESPQGHLFFCGRKQAYWRHEVPDSTSWAGQDRLHLLEDRFPLDLGRFDQSV